MLWVALWYSYLGSRVTPNDLGFRMFYQQKSALALRNSNKVIGGKRLSGPYWAYETVGQKAHAGESRKWLVRLQKRRANDKAETIRSGARI